MDKTMEENRTYSVYCHTSPEGKKYVGISYDPERRWKKGYGYKSNRHLWGAIQKYGWENFTHEIIINGLSYKEAKQKEAELIKDLDLLNQDKGYNHSPSGDIADYTFVTWKKQSESKQNNSYNVGRILSDETKIKISKSLKEHYKSSDVKGPNFGRIFSEETRKRMSEASKNRTVEQKQSITNRLPHRFGGENWNSKAVIREDNDGNEVVFGAISEASRLSGEDIFKNGIERCCKGVQDSYKGYKWRYANETKEDWQNRRNEYIKCKQLNKKEPRRNPPKGKTHHASIPIKCVDANENEIEFDCISDGARFICGDFSNNKRKISERCKENGGIYKGFRWYFI